MGLFSEIIAFDAALSLIVMGLLWMIPSVRWQSSVCRGRVDLQAGIVLALGSAQAAGTLMAVVALEDLKVSP